MKSWPPSTPDTDIVCDVFAHMKDNIRNELKNRNLSAADKSLTQYMRTSNVGTALVTEAEGPYKNQLVVSFDTVTDRDIRPKMLRVFQVSPDGDGIFVVPTAITHAAVNGVSKRDAGVLADELVGGFYEQYAIAAMMRVSKKELRKISPERYTEKLHEIYEMIRQRALAVIEGE